MQIHIDFPKNARGKTQFYEILSMRNWYIRYKMAQKLIEAQLALTPVIEEIQELAGEFAIAKGQYLKEKSESSWHNPEVANRISSEFNKCWQSIGAAARIIGNGRNAQAIEDAKKSITEAAKALKPIIVSMNDFKNRIVVQINNILQRVWTAITKAAQIIAQPQQPQQIQKPMPMAYPESGNPSSATPMV